MAFLDQSGNFGPMVFVLAETFILTFGKFEIWLLIFLLLGTATFDGLDALETTFLTLRRCSATFGNFQTDIVSKRVFPTKIAKSAIFGL